MVCADIAVELVEQFNLVWVRASVDLVADHLGDVTAPLREVHHPGRQARVRRDAADVGRRGEQVSGDALGHDGESLVAGQQGAESALVNRQVQVVCATRISAIPARRPGGQLGDGTGRRTSRQQGDGSGFAVSCHSHSELWICGWRLNFAPYPYPPELCKLAEVSVKATTRSL